MNRSISVVLCLITFIPLAVPAAGQTWISLGPSTGSVRRVVVAPSQPSTALAIPDAGGLFLTTNAGASWRSISAGLCDVHVSQAAFHPAAPATIYTATASGGVCRSTDGGATWAAAASGPPTSDPAAATATHPAPPSVDR